MRILKRTQSLIEVKPDKIWDRSQIVQGKVFDNGYYVAFASIASALKFILLYL